MESDRFIKAFQKMHRVMFLPDSVKGEADYDVPMPIGFEQTNSQPTTVKIMLHWLNPQPGEKILDLGSGSCWTTALLSELVGADGKIIAVEKVPELVDFGASNLRKAGVTNAEVYKAKKVLGLPEEAPYDRILVSAAAKDLPQELLDQLKIGGRLVIPIKSSIWVINKTPDNNFLSTEHPGFAFVPLL